MQSRHFNTLSELLVSARGEALRQTEHAYLLVDGVRAGKLSEAVGHRHAGTWRCLLDAAFGSPLFEVSPALIQVGENDKPALRLLSAEKYRQSSQLLLSALPLEILAAQLARYFYVDEADNTRWMLAFWDPFVMAGLIGMQPPLNDLVPGSILEAPQCAGLLLGMEGIVLQNRQGVLQFHEIASMPPAAEPPIKLTQAQMDRLMDIDLPDRVAAMLRKAEPHHPISDADCHRLCCAAIVEARSRNKHGLDDYCDSALAMLAASDDTGE